MSRRTCRARLAAAWSTGTPGPLHRRIAAHRRRVDRRDWSRRLPGPISRPRHSTACSGHIALDRASVFRQPFSNMHARVVVDEKSPNVIQVDNLTAGLYGGQLGGQARVTFGSGLQYSLYLAAVGAQLDEFARQNTLQGSAELSGAARAESISPAPGRGSTNSKARPRCTCPTARSTTCRSSSTCSKCSGCIRRTAPRSRKAISKLAFMAASSTCSGSISWATRA